MADVPKRLSPRKTPVQARSFETRARVLDAAARVFSRHGYSAGTTNRIAAEADLSIGSLYQYFPNKDAILVELMRSHIAAGTKAVGDRLQQAEHLGEDLRSRVGSFVDAAIANHIDDPGLHQVLFEEAPRPPELLAELREMERRLIATVTALLAADPAVHVTDPAMAARMVVTTVESVVHRVMATRERSVDIQAFRQEMTDMLVRYLSGDGDLSRGEGRAGILGR